MRTRFHPVLRFFPVRSASVALALAGVVPACGSLDTHTDSVPPLATLTGEVVNPQAMAVRGATRVAVVWQAGAAGEFNVAEDLPVQPVFPSSFTIQLDDPPPASALTDGSSLFGAASGATPAGPAAGNGPGPDDAGLSSVPTAPGGPKGQALNGADGLLKLQGGSTTSASSEVAFGVVVAYLDKNGNGKLDLVPDDASGYVDEILATNQNELLVYFQGSIPDGAVGMGGRPPTLGYNLYSTCDVMLPPSDEGSLCRAVLHPAQQPVCNEQWQSIETPVTLTVGANPQVNTIMCLTSDDSGSESIGANGPTLNGTPPGGYPGVCDANLNCYPDGSSYMYNDCQTISEGLCEGTETTCTSVTYARPTPVPADWPCKH